MLGKKFAPRKVAATLLTLILIIVLTMQVWAVDSPDTTQEGSIDVLSDDSIDALQEEDALPGESTDALSEEPADVVQEDLVDVLSEGLLENQQEGNLPEQNIIEESPENIPSEDSFPFEFWIELNGEKYGPGTTHKIELLPNTRIVPSINVIIRQENIKLDDFDFSFRNQYQYSYSYSRFIYMDDQYTGMSSSARSGYSLSNQLTFTMNTFAAGMREGGKVIDRVSFKYRGQTQTIDYTIEWNSEEVIDTHWTEPVVESLNSTPEGGVCVVDSSSRTHLPGQLFCALRGENKIIETKKDVDLFRVHGQNMDMLEDENYTFETLAVVLPVIESENEYGGTTYGTQTAVDTSTRGGDDSDPSGGSSSDDDILTPEPTVTPAYYGGSDTSSSVVRTRSVTPAVIEPVTEPTTAETSTEISQPEVAALNDSVVPAAAGAESAIIVTSKVAPISLLAIAGIALAAVLIVLLAIRKIIRA